MGGVTLIKVFALVGIIVLLTSTITGTTPTAWTDVRNVLKTGIVFPTFLNPFADNTITLTSYADTPFEFRNDGVNASSVGAFGCNNNTLERSSCLKNTDGDTSFIQMHVKTEGGFPVDTWNRFSFNYSNGAFKQVNSSSLRGVSITVQCRTEENATSAQAFLLYWSRAGPAAFLHCPKGDYQTVTFQQSFPNGFPTGGVTHPFAQGGQFNNQQVTFATADIIPDNVILAAEDVVNVGFPVARFTYFKIDAVVSTESTCVPPEGAWFPVVDAVACAIINFASIIADALLFVINGIVFLAVSFAAIVGFVGFVIVGFFLGIFQVYGVLFTLGAPSPVQEVIDLIALSSIGYIFFATISTLRGSEP